MRIFTGLGQSEFAAMINIPVATFKDWEIGRRTPLDYVVNMIQTILQYKGFLADSSDAKEERRKSVERCLAFLLTAIEGPNDLFMEALDAYIEGQISLSEMEKRVDRLEYIGA